MTGVLLPKLKTEESAVPVPLLSWLFQKMLFWMVGLLLSLCMPPPLLAVLPEKEMLVSVGLLSLSLSMPPP